MIELRDYQRDLLAGMRQAMHAGHRRVCVTAPVGAGKTRVMGAAIEAAREADDAFTGAAFLAERTVLVHQARAAFGAMGLSAGVVQAESRAYGADVVCYSQQTCESRDEWPDETLIFVDEAHVARTQVTDWIRGRARPDQWIIGMTATPMRTGMGDTWDVLVKGPTTASLTDAGWLAPMEVWEAKPIDLSGARVNRATGEWVGEDLEERVSVIVGDIAENWYETCCDLFGCPAPTMVFTPTVAAGRKLVRVLNGIRHDGVDVSAVQVSYQDSTDHRRNAIAGFLAGEHDAIVSVSVLGRGFDAPHAQVLVDASPYRSSLMAYVQMLGRVLRASPGKEKAYVFDHAGNYGRFLPEWEAYRRHGPGPMPPDRQPTDTDERGERGRNDDDGGEIVGAWTCGCGQANVIAACECGACGADKPEKHVGRSRPPGAQEGSAAGRRGRRHGLPEAVRVRMEAHRGTRRAPLLEAAEDRHAEAARQAGCARQGQVHGAVRRVVDVAPAGVARAGGRSAHTVLVGREAGRTCGPVQASLRFPPECAGRERPSAIRVGSLRRMTSGLARSTSTVRQSVMLHPLAQARARRAACMRGSIRTITVLSMPEVYLDFWASRG